jgi:hypothetical protein
MAARRTPAIVAPPCRHPLVGVPSGPVPWVIIVLIGWVVWLGWRPEQVVALLVVLVPAAAGARAREAG